MKIDNNKPVLILAAAAVPTTSQRLQEIEHLHAGGAMSEDEYNAERARIIASI